MADVRVSSTLFYVRGSVLLQQVWSGMRLQSGQTGYLGHLHRHSHGPHLTDWHQA